MAFNAFSERATNPSNDFQPQLTTEPTAPGEDVMCQNNLRTGDDFIIVDYKPTESLKADDNFLVDPPDPSVDPNNPNVDLTPGPDDNVSLPGFGGSCSLRPPYDGPMAYWTTARSSDGRWSVAPRCPDGRKIHPRMAYWTNTVARTRNS